MLYLFLSSTGSSLTTNASLLIVNPPITKLAEPTSARYSYSIWVYVNTWDNTIPKKIIFSRDNNIILSLAQNSPTLMAEIFMTDGSYIEMAITENFPIQKWVNVIVSMDSQYLDCYLDGKLVKSHKMSLPSGNGRSIILPQTPPDSTLPVVLGGTSSNSTKFDATVTNFVRWPNAINPQTAWDTYMKGNGTNTLFGAFSSFGARLSLSKNSENVYSFQMF